MKRCALPIAVASVISPLAPLTANMQAFKQGSASPAELPIEQPTKFQLVLNLLRADEVMQ